MNASQQPTAIFVADSHFHLEPDDAEQRRLELFLDLLSRCREVDHLVLLGDIFDFWFDYPHFRLKGFESLLQALDAARRAGTQIHFVGGNHDIWATTYLRRRFGCIVHGERDIVALGSRRIRLCHGDGMFKYDWAYRTFRAIVRHRAGVLMAKSLHPEILYALSVWLSSRSRTASRDEIAVIESRAEKWLARQEDEPWDLMVIGHLHHGFRHTVGARTLAVLPGWLTPLGYGVLRNGEFQLRDFERDPWP